MIMLCGLASASPVFAQATPEDEPEEVPALEEMPRVEAEVIPPPPPPAFESPPLPPPPPTVAPAHRRIIVIQRGGEDDSQDPMNEKNWHTVLGAGMLILPPGNGATGRQVFPTVQLELQSRIEVSPRTEAHLFVAFSMFNWGTFRNIYDWFAEGTSEEHQMRLAAGWMLMPMAFTVPAFTPWVSHVSGGATVVRRTSEQTPRVLFGGGAGLSLFLRPTDQVAFLGIHVNGIVGIDFSETFGLSLRCIWDPPIVPGLLTDKTNNLFSLSLSMVLSH
jgi:hypothetical protein